MPDNLPPAFVGYPRLPGHQLLSLQGPDAAVFAHAQFSSDVTALPLLHWQWSAWLSAKGRTLAVFQLLRLADDHLMLVLADGDADAIASQLQRFVFRRKVKVLVRDDLAAAGAFTAPEAASGARLRRPQVMAGNWTWAAMPCRAPCASAPPMPLRPAAKPMRPLSPWPGARPTCATGCRGWKKASARCGPRSSWAWTV